MVTKVRLTTTTASHPTPEKENGMPKGIVFSSQMNPGRGVLATLGSGGAFRRNLIHSNRRFRVYINRRGSKLVVGRHQIYTGNGPRASGPGIVRIGGAGRGLAVQEQARLNNGFL